MQNVVLQPTPDILRLADLIDEGLVRFIKARFTVPESRKWESHVEASLLLGIVIRNAEAILDLARKDLVLLPAANVLARTVFEVTVKAAWMVQPNDPYDREINWLVHIREEARLNKQISDNVIKSGGDARIFQERASTLRDFADEVAAALPAGYAELPRNPRVEDMLETIEQGKIYPFYRLLAAYVHGGHTSTWLYRRHLGTYKEHGEFITPADWYIPLNASWSSVHLLGPYILEHLGASEPQFVSPEDAAAIDSAFTLLNSTSSRTRR